jgi:hypothetical protein
MVVRKIADYFGKLIAFILWAAIGISILVTLAGLGIAAENSYSFGGFLVQFISIVGIQLVGMIFFILIVGMMAVFIDIRLTLIEIRDQRDQRDPEIKPNITSSIGTREHAKKATNNQQEVELKQERKETPIKSTDDDNVWRDLAKLDALPSDPYGALKSFVEKNKIMFERKKMSPKVLHGGRAWQLIIKFDGGEKTFKIEDLSGLTQWYDDH